MSAAGRLRVPEDAALRAIWAKSPVAPGGEGESLAAHTAHVLERLADQRRLRPDLGERLGDGRFWNRLFRAVFIHDWGKAASGFQRQVRDPEFRWGKRHEVLSLAFVPYVAVDTEDARWIAAAVASHHREESDLRSRYNVGTGRPAHRREIVTLVEEVEEESLGALWRWLGESGCEWAQSLGFGEISFPSRPRSPETRARFRERAVETICDSLEEYYDAVQDLERRRPRDPLALAPLLLRGLTMTADHAGSAHAPPFAPAPLPAAEGWLAAMEERWGGVHPHQRECARAEGSIQLVAPTGSGKTESALLWAARQAEAAAAPRLFYVLPYQASMNAMRDRLAGHFGEERVGLQHGKARHVLYRRYLERDPSPARAAWAARAEQDLVRLHLPPVRVVSPWQLLKAFYRLRGYEAVLTELQGSLVICDEIHAYEVERLSLVMGMMGCLAREFDARFCLMSATFPAFLRQWLAEDLQPLTEISAAAETQAAFRRHRVHFLPGDLLEEEALARIRAAAQEGRSVLVCCNTVGRAQGVYERLREAGLSPELLHSRFHAADRNEKERRLQERMGTHAAGRVRRVVMVATQVVEVSLDIDFELLFSDLAPLEALLQRLGRVNRGRRRALCDAYIFAGSIVDRRPYRATLLEGARRVLEREFGREGAELDEVRTSDWLDEIYTGDLLAEWEATYRDRRREFEEAILGTLHPFQAAPHLEEQFYRAFDGVEVLPLGLREEYLARLDLHPLAASELLVPIRWGQLGSLRRAGRVLDAPEADGTLHVDCPYSSRLGLELER